MTAPGARLRDLREDPAYRDALEWLRATHEPAVGRVAEAHFLAPSPDGGCIVYGGPAFERAVTGKPGSGLAVTGAYAGAARELANASLNVTGAAWSPDESTLAYASGSGLTLLAGLDGSAREVRSPDGPIESIAWSSDSRRLLVQTAAAESDACGAAGSGRVTEGRGDASDAWLPHVESSEEPGGWRTAWILDVAGGNVVWRSPDGLNVWEAAWCGDDAVVAIVSNDPSENSWYFARLVHVDCATSCVRELFVPHEEIGVPAGSPDGRYATAIISCSSDRTLVAGQLLLIDVSDAAPHARAIDTGDVDVTFATWRDPHRLLYAGIARLHTVVAEYDVRTNKSRELFRTIESSGGDAPLIAPYGPGDAFVVAVDSYGHYQRILAVENAHARVVHDLAHEGSALVAREGGTSHAIGWTGRDGLEIDGFLVLPNGPGPFPLLVNVHGGPVFSFRDEWSMHYPYVPYLVRLGYAVLNPNPRGSRGRGTEFARMVRGDMCGEDAFDIVRGIEMLAERGIVDPARVAITGRSYGGYMACWLVTQTRAFAAAIAASPVTDAFSHHFTCNIPEFDREFLRDAPFAPQGAGYAARSPVFFADRAATPTMLVAGARDNCTPSGQALEFHRALRENGVPTDLVVYPEEGHHVDAIEARADLFARMRLWLDRYASGKS